MTPADMAAGAPVPASFTAGSARQAARRAGLAPPARHAGAGRARRLAAGAASVAAGEIPGPRQRLGRAYAAPKGMARSTAAATCATRSSRQGGATICSPTGMPSSPVPARTAPAGLPVRLNG